ncbi:hypothetical protein BBbe_10555 [Bartonella bovis 91-4]|uniref:Right handed beta helix domain-containing protein n=1 Tax=Bartonella bovis 91-4 TaxID=1094491 RepID=N6VHF0_9HYPH|nr:hypothetical protein [Bartonella bovis]ENN90502.1 hypothetical protein BBbe_10555 [Bartonella bovis 91-4]
MTMTNVNISKVKVGVDVQKGKLEMIKGSINFTGGRGNYGVHVQNGAESANLMGVTITGEGGQGMGLYVVGTGAVTMNMGEISNVESGVYATGAGTLKMDGTTITFESGSGSYGVKVQNGVKMANLTSVTITGKGGQGTGVIMESTGVGATGALNMTGVNISNVAMGVEVMGAKAVTISGGTTIQFTGGSGYGVRVGDRVTMANLTDVTIKGKGGQGTGMIKDGTGTMTLTEVGISGVKVGVEVTSGNLTISGGTMTGVQTGITMMGSGTLMVNEGTTITFEGAGHGVKVGSGVVANITGAMIKGTSGGTGKGVWMESTRTMMIRGGGDKKMLRVGCMQRGRGR